MQVGTTDGDTLSDFKDRNVIAHGSGSIKNEGAGWLSALEAVRADPFQGTYGFWKLPVILALLSLKTHSLALTQPLCFLLTLEST